MSMISLSRSLPSRTWVLGAATTALLAAAAGVAARAHIAAAASYERGRWSAHQAVSPDPTASVQVKERYGHLPLSFEANHGQTDSKVQFLSRGGGYTLFLTSKEAVLALSQFAADERRDAARIARSPIGGRPRTSAVVRMTLMNANRHSKGTGHDALPGKSHYLIGRNPTRWCTNISTYAKVKYQDVYPGVDLVYYGNHGQLEYDFVVAPSADPGLVTLAFEGTRDLRIDARGDLVLHVEGGGELRQQKPVVYQERAGVREKVAGRYVMKGTRRVGVQVAPYDRSRPLVIDPVLVYSTYLGGSAGESGNGIAVDGAGSAYVTGFTTSPDFPTTAGAVQTTAGGTEAFVTKLDATGSRLVYSTYLGGSADDQAFDVAVDGAGNTYVTGFTTSTDFPTTAGGFQPSHAVAHEFDAFVAKLDATGSRLVYSTYLGGSGSDLGLDIAVDGAGSAYVTGNTAESTDFPTTAGAFQTTPGVDVGGFPGFDAFVTKLDATGSGLVYSTYLGGSGSEQGLAIAVDGAGSAYVTGDTRSTDFPTSAGAVQTTFAGISDAYVTKLDATGSRLVYSTYLGGTGSEQAVAIALDSGGSAYLTGGTDSSNFPTTAGAFQTTPVGDPFPVSAAFVTKLDPTGSGLVYSTYLGGSANEAGAGIAVDGAGSVHVTGFTDSTDFPTTADAIQMVLGGGFTDAFVTKLDATGSGLVYSTYLGGDAPDQGSDIAVDGAGSAYVAGATGSTDFPTTAEAFQTTLAGGDAFVAKIGSSVALPTSKDQCKNGGWNTFGMFKNQGDCVSFVATKGKNRPSRP
jgi:hypothetical protein